MVRPLSRASSSAAGLTVANPHSMRLTEPRRASYGPCGDQSGLRGAIVRNPRVPIAARPALCIADVVVGVVMWIET